MTLWSFEHLYTFAKNSNTKNSNASSCSHSQRWKQEKKKKNYCECSGVDRTSSDEKSVQMWRTIAIPVLAFLRKEHCPEW